MAEAHFVRDYRRVVAQLMTSHPIDAAMALAVGGGDYETVGALEADILIECGLGPGRSIVEIGCGSGRLSTQLSKRFGDDISYRGFDVVLDLVSYARLRALPTYDFSVTDGCTIPAPNESADFVAAFSVLTHLRKQETLSYLREARRVLRPGGRFVFSFLELPHHAKIFGYTLLVTIMRRRKVQNHFLSRRLLMRWCDELGLAIERILPPERLGQTVAVLRRKIPVQ